MADHGPPCLAMAGQRSAVALPYVGHKRPWPKAGHGGLQPAGPGPRLAMAGPRRAQVMARLGRPKLATGTFSRTEPPKTNGARPRTAPARKPNHDRAARACAATPRPDPPTGPAPPGRGQP